MEILERENLHAAVPLAAAFSASGRCRCLFEQQLHHVGRPDVGLAVAGLGDDRLRSAADLKPVMVWVMPLIAKLRPRSVVFSTEDRREIAKGVGFLAADFRFVLERNLQFESSARLGKRATAGADRDAVRLGHVLQGGDDVVLQLGKVTLVEAGDGDGRQ